MAVTTKVGSRFGQSNDARCEGMPPFLHGLLNAQLTNICEAAEGGALVLVCKEL